jgi:hypothetical protein
VNSANEDSAKGFYYEFKFGNKIAASGENSTKGNSQVCVLSCALQTPAINGQSASLSSVQDIHPPYGFSVTDFSQIYLGCLQILMSQDNLGDNLQRHAISAGICR